MAEINFKNRKSIQNTETKTLKRLKSLKINVTERETKTETENKTLTRLKSMQENININENPKTLVL